MRQRSTQTRLKTAMVKGNLTVADLARWFTKPYATVRQWIEFGREPRGAPQDVRQLGYMLRQLETLIGRKRELPVPGRLAPKARIAYLNRVRRAAR